MRMTLALVSLALVACSTTSPVRQIGPDLYLVDYTQRGKISGWNEIKAKSYDAAQAHCAQMGKQMEEVAMDTHGARGWTPVGAELKFRCVPR